MASVRGHVEPQSQYTGSCPPPTNGHSILPVAQPQTAVVILDPLPCHTLCISSCTSSGGPQEALPALLCPPSSMAGPLNTGQTLSLLLSVAPHSLQKAKFTGWPIAHDLPRALSLTSVPAMSLPCSLHSSHSLSSYPPGPPSQTLVPGSSLHLDRSWVHSPHNGWG